MSLYKNYIKRLLDIILSLSGLIILLPVLLIIAILVRVKIGSPVLFTQERPGKDEKIFKLYKFRTMTDSRDTEGNLLPDSKRLTKFGKFLRSTSLDELPELWNIFKGDMSLVGPRPLAIRYLPYYTDREKLRHSIRPGLTGLAQVKGRNNLEWDKRLNYDVEYVRKLSFNMDFIIILLTLHKVIKKDDVTVVDQGPIKDLDIERSKVNENR